MRSLDTGIHFCNSLSGLRESSARTNAMNFPAEIRDRCRAYIAPHLPREGFMPMRTLFEILNCSVSLGETSLRPRVLALSKTRTARKSKRKNPATNVEKHRQTVQTPNLKPLGQCPAKPGQRRPGPGQSWPNSGQLRPKLANRGQRLRPVAMARSFSLTKNKKTPFN